MKAHINLHVPYVREVLLDTPTAYYRFNEVSGSTTAADTSGAGLTGTYAGTITFGVSDPITDDVDGAITIAAANLGYMVTPVLAPISLVGSWSAEIWFKHAVTATAQPILTGWNSTTQVMSLLMAADGTLFVGGLTGANLTTVTEYDDGAWHQAALTYNGTTLRLYVDGVEKDNDTVGFGSDTLSYFVAGSQLGFTSWWDGSLDELSVYASTLSATRVQAHYDQRNGGLNDLPGTRINRICSYAGLPSTMY